jgi:DNA primase
MRPAVILIALTLFLYSYVEIRLRPRTLTIKLVAYCGRSLDGTEPRYKFPGITKSQIFFNLHRAPTAGAETAIVVEGFSDCLKLDQAGFGSVVALIGQSQRWLLTDDFGGSS